MPEEVPFYEKYPLYDQFWYNDRLLSGMWISKEHLQEIPQLHVQDSDILIAAYPKSGNHWTGQITTLLVNEQNMDGVVAKQFPQRAPWLEDLKSNAEFEARLQDACPRVYCSHLTPEMLPPAFKTRGKLISLYRNPKDLAVSYFYFYKMNKRMNFYSGSWNEFVQAFINEHVEFGSYLDYIHEWWSVKDQYNIYFLSYERLSRDLAGEIRKLAEFLGCNPSEKTVARIVEYSSFQYMKDSPGTNRLWDEDAGIFDCSNSGCKFFRNGKVNDWKNHFTVKQNEDFEEYIKEKERKHGVIFPRD